MKHFALYLAFIGTSIVALPSLAVDTQDHKAHHPEETANSVPAKPAASTDDTRQRMEMQMKSMQEMHDKMMNAKTPEERKALMEEQMKTMQSGMAMMKEMSSQKGNIGDPSSMQMCMDMMEMMMQMMTDRMSTMPAQ